MKVYAINKEAGINDWFNRRKKQNTPTPQPAAISATQQAFEKYIKPSIENKNYQRVLSILEKLRKSISTDIINNLEVKHGLPNSIVNNNIGVIDKIADDTMALYIAKSDDYVLNPKKSGFLGERYVNQLEYINLQDFGENVAEEAISLYKTQIDSILESAKTQNNESVNEGNAPSENTILEEDNDSTEGVSFPKELIHEPVEKQVNDPIDEQSIRRKYSPENVRYEEDPRPIESVPNELLNVEEQREQLDRLARVANGEATPEDQTVIQEAVNQAEVKQQQDAQALSEPAPRMNKAEVLEAAVNTIREVRSLANSLTMMYYEAEKNNDWNFFINTIKQYFYVDIVDDIEQAVEQSGQPAQASVHTFNVKIGQNGQIDRDSMSLVLKKLPMPRQQVPEGKVARRFPILHK